MAFSLLDRSATNLVVFSDLPGTACIGLAGGGFCAITVGLLEQGLIAGDLLLQVLFDVFHSLLEVHLGNYACLAPISRQGRLAGVGAGTPLFSLEPQTLRNDLPGTLGLVGQRRLRSQTLLLLLVLAKFHIAAVKRVELSGIPIQELLMQSQFTASHYGLLLRGRFLH